MTTQTDIQDDPNYRPVLDYGFVGIKDVMGSDQAIDDAARLSYGAGTRSVSDVRTLIRYLFRNRHCYHPTMQVLTARGWLCWDACGAEETFLVPDPTTHTYRAERLPVLKFPVTEELHTFQNNRMSYKVTSEHKMWFKSKYAETFEKVPVDSMSPWGWFEPLTEYDCHDPQNIFANHPEPDMWFRFIGFYLGDGSYASTNRVTFHLKKESKINYIFHIIHALGLPHHSIPSATHEDGILISVTTPDFLRHWIDVRLRSAEKAFPLFRLEELSLPQKLGLLEGLVASDGSAKRDRNQVEFSSSSVELVGLIQALFPLFGYDAHHCIGTEGMYSVRAYPSGRTTLESRKDYHGREFYTGDVYCATTSTGLLAVRGGSDTFGFVCGNTSPVEMCEVKLHIRLPIFVMRQLIRHRTHNLNEYSGRYSEMSDEFYLPEPDMILPQSTTNKQGRGGRLSAEHQAEIRSYMKASYGQSHDGYRALLAHRDDTADLDALQDPDFTGIARETARMVLPLSSYTEVIWKQNLHNLFHLLKLRLDPHAQYEMRVYADAIYALIQPLFPIATEAFEDYHRQAVTLSRMEVNLLRDLITALGGWNHFCVKQKLHATAIVEQYGLTRRELGEFLTVVAPPTPPDA